MKPAIKVAPKPHNFTKSKPFYVLLSLVFIYLLILVARSGITGIDPTNSYTPPSATSPVSGVSGQTQTSGGATSSANPISPSTKSEPAPIYIPTPHAVPQQPLTPLTSQFKAVVPTTPTSTCTPLSGEGYIAGGTIVTCN